MKTQWPEVINLRFESNGNIASGVLAFVLLNSRIKNNFSVGFYLIDENGFLTLRRDELRNIIKQEKDNYPMDYDGELEDCDGLEVIVENENDLLERINRLRAFYPDEATRIAKLSANSSNWKYATYKGAWRAPSSSKEIAISLTEC